ncbi:50S ribosomal protein L21 [Paracoccaceae bacterium GXU_MW_L88]
MFAVVKTGGKQYKVAKDDVLKVERINADAGETVQFNDILMLGGDKVTVGAPLIDGAAVQAEIIDHIRGEKVISFVKRRRKHSSKRRRGHRQHLSVVRITDILASGGDKSGVKAAIGGLGEAVAEEVTGKKPAKKAEKKAAPKAEKKAEPKKAAPKKAAKKDDAKADDAPAAAGTKPGNLLSKPEGDKDDLKKISGVGPKLEELLNENGVFHFWQIAAWKKAEIEYMDDQLSFSGRIERDDWIKQAKDLAAEAK